MTRQYTRTVADKARVDPHLDHALGFFQEAFARPDIFEQIPTGSKLFVTQRGSQDDRRPDGPPVACTEHHEVYVVPRTDPEADDSP